MAEQFERAEGFYWVKPKNGDWEIAKYIDKEWLLFGFEGEAIRDDYWAEIDDEPIEQEPEQPEWLREAIRLNWQNINNLQPRGGALQTTETPYADAAWEAYRTAPPARGDIEGSALRNAWFDGRAFGLVEGRCQWCARATNVQRAHAWPEPQPITDAQKTGERLLVWHKESGDWKIAAWFKPAFDTEIGWYDDFYRLIDEDCISLYLPLPPDAVSGSNLFE